MPRKTQWQNHRLLQTTEATTARLPYADPANPEIAEQVARIRAERGGKLLALYAMLLNYPAVADGWRQLLTAIRQQYLLPARQRELAILRP